MRKNSFITHRSAVIMLSKAVIITVYKGEAIERSKARSVEGRSRDLRAKSKNAKQTGYKEMLTCKGIDGVLRFQRQLRGGIQMKKRIVIALALVLTFAVISSIFIQACKPVKELNCSLEDQVEFCGRANQAYCKFIDAHGGEPYYIAGAYIDDLTLTILVTEPVESVRDEITRYIPEDILVIKQAKYSLVDLNKIVEVLSNEWLPVAKDVRGLGADERRNKVVIEIVGHTTTVAAVEDEILSLLSKKRISKGNGEIWQDSELANVFDYEIVKGWYSQPILEG